MKKCLVVFVLLTLAVCSACYLFVERPKVKLITSEQGSFLEMAQGLVEELNKLPEEDLPNKKIDFYVANFTNNNIPKIRNKNHYNILYLGSRRGFDIEKVQGFDKIFVSTPDLKAYFEEQGINTEFLQISWKNKGITADINNKDKWLLIGENSETEKELRNLGINYDKINSFALENEKKILEKLSEIKGVIIENPKESEESLDFSPLVLEIIARKIPILTNSRILEVNFNDSFYYYSFLNLEYALELEKKDKSILLESYKNFEKINDNKIVTRKILKNITRVGLPNKENISLMIRGSIGDYSNGDYWFTRDLGQKLEEKGYPVYTFYNSSAIKSLGGIDIYNVSDFLFDIIENKENITLIQFLYASKLADILNWIKENKNKIDALIVASDKMREFFKQQGIRTFKIPQYTNKNKFYPDYDEALKSDILFVGNNYIERKAPKIAIKKGLPITIYGDFWQGFAKEKYIDNRILRKYYSSAKINLNDHRPDMIENGFINNRTFDVTASGGFLISDYMPEIEEIYGDSIPMWKTEEELVELLNYYLDPAHEEERLEKAARARDITLKNFTSDIVAEKFDEIIKELKREKGLD